MARWAIYLSQYTFDVEYVPGKTLGNADALSRMPFHELPVAQAEPNFDVTDKTVVASVVKDNIQQQGAGIIPNVPQEGMVFAWLQKNIMRQQAVMSF